MLSKTNFTKGKRNLSKVNYNFAAKEIDSQKVFIITMRQEITSIFFFC